MLINTAAVEVMLVQKFESSNTESISKVKNKMSNLQNIRKKTILQKCEDLVSSAKKSKEELLGSYYKLNEEITKFMKDYFRINEIEKFISKSENTVVPLSDESKKIVDNYINFLDGKKNSMEFYLSKYQKVAESEKGILPAIGQLLIFANQVLKLTKNGELKSVKEFEKYEQVLASSTEKAKEMFNKYQLAVNKFAYELKIHTDQTYKQLTELKQL